MGNNKAFEIRITGSACTLLAPSVWSHCRPSKCTGDLLDITKNEFKDAQKAWFRQIPTRDKKVERASIQRDEIKHEYRSVHCYTKQPVVGSLRRQRRLLWQRRFVTSNRKCEFLQNAKKSRISHGNVLRWWFFAAWLLLTSWSRFFVR